MTLKQLAEQFVAELKAGKIGEAFETGSKILAAAGSFYKLVFGGAAVTETAEDTAEVEAELVAISNEFAAKPVAAGPSAAVDPALILMVIDLVLKIIAERRKNRQP